MSKTAPSPPAPASAPGSDPGSDPGPAHVRPPGRDATQGPRLLFFSGGTALNEISRRLKAYTQNSVHLITPFDSGGSSQVLRKAFGMPAVGDLRSRLMALADETDRGQPEILRLFTHRFAKHASQRNVTQDAARLFEGTHPLLQGIPMPVRQQIREDLRQFQDAAPADLDYRNASIGNLILAGGYLRHGRQLEPVLAQMSRMVAVRGTVRPIADVNLEIGAQLRDGRRVIGQRRMTGKEHLPLTSPIARLFLSDGTRELPADAVPLPQSNQDLIAGADLICYPPGSLYSSVICNLLPKGVGQAIAARNVPKVYVPSLGTDPECLAMTLSDQISALLAPLRRDAGDVATSAFLSHVICDLSVSEAARAEVLRDHGIRCIARPLAVSSGKSPCYAPDALCRQLLALV